jgi:hypothetical protein
MAFVRTTPHTSLDIAAARFVAKQDIMNSSRLTYAKSLSAVLHKRFTTTTPVLKMYMSGLVAQGATRPTFQAKPISRAEVDALLPTLSPDIQAFCLLAWKTAARWGDMSSLTTQSFKLLTPTRIVLNWGQTKTTRFTPFAPTLWAVIDDVSPTRLQPIINRVRQLQADEPFLSMTTEAFDRLMYSRKLQWTAHSFKRGAITFLINQVATRKLEFRYLALLAKHKDALHNYPESTLRYADDEIALATMLGTQHATVLL